MTDTKATKRKLEAAGWEFASGWLPKDNPALARFRAQVSAWEDDKAKRLAEPAKPRGRPKKEPS